MKDLGTNNEQTILESFKIGRNRSEYYFYLKRGQLPDTVYRAYVEPDFWEAELELLKKKYSDDAAVSESIYDCERKCYELKRVYFPEPGIMFVFDNQQLNKQLFIHYDIHSDLNLVESLKSKLLNYHSTNRHNEIGYLVANQTGLNVMMGSFKPYKEDYQGV